MGFMDEPGDERKAQLRLSQNNIAKSADPRAPFDFSVKNEEPLTVTDAMDNTVKFNLLGNGRAMLTDPSLYEGQDLKGIVKSTILETVQRCIEDKNILPDPHDIKTLMLISHRLITPVTDALTTKGFKVAFKMLNLTKAQVQ